MAIQYVMEEPVLLGDSTVHVMNIVFEPFMKTIPAHSHGSNCYELHFTPIGSGVLEVQGKVYEIKPGSLYVTGPHLEHAQTPDKTDPMQEYCIYLRIKKGTGNRISWLNDFCDTGFWFGEDHGSVHVLLRQIFEEFAGQKTGYDMQTRLLMVQLMITMTRYYENSKGHEEYREKVHTTDQNTLLIEECFLYEYRTLTLQTLSDRLHLSARQTQRLLKNYYGATFGQKKREAQMSAAEILLKENEKSIADIAEELGYSSPEYFTNTFRKQYGVSPSKYREESENENFNYQTWRSGLRA